MKGACKPKPNGSPCGAGKACAGGVCKAAAPPPPPPTCTDEVKNGAETGINRGGPACPRRGRGQACANRGDRASARRAGGARVACSNGDCGPDRDCFGRVCQSLDGTTIASCEECPPNTAECIGPSFGDVVYCYAYRGA